MISKNKKQNHNSGFSLVELLVAVTILLIIVIPILHSFITASRTNKKARDTMAATEVAKNMMEELQAYSLNELKSLYTVAENTDSTLSISIDDVDAGTSSYNVQITLDPTVYKEESGSNSMGYNNLEEANIACMDVLKDGFFLEETDGQSEVAQTFLESYLAAGGTSSYTAEHFQDIMYRTITLSVDETTDSDNNLVTVVSIKYTYAVSDTKIPYGERTIESPKETIIYDNAEYSESLRAIYLFYEPLYNSKIGRIKEKIEVENYDNLPFHFYIVKQKSSYYTVTKENQYMAQINVYENPDSGWDFDSSFQACTSIRTNLGWSLFVDKTELANIQTKIRYEGNSTAISGTDARAVVDYDSLDAPTTEDKVYGAVVDVYEITSGGNKYDSDKKIVSIDGSKEEQ